jgi:hypothetical protein
LLLAVAAQLCLVAPAGAGADPPDSGAPPAPVTFNFGSPDQKKSFTYCLDAVRQTTKDNGSSIHSTVRPEGPDPEWGIEDWDEDRWKEAFDADWFLWKIHFEAFSFRPKCHLFLPSGWENQIAPRYQSEVFRRCEANVHPGSASADAAETQRPKIVPAWHWMLSLEIKSCWPLLPWGAFGLGTGEDYETNGWSSWTSDMEVSYPKDSPNPRVMQDYGACQEYVQWRFREGQGNRFTNDGGLPGRWHKAPNGSTPEVLWHEAINFFKGLPARHFWDGATPRTTPLDWFPDCEKLLVIEECRTSTAENPQLMPEQCVGTHAIRNFDINYSQYDSENEEGTPSITRNLWGGATNFAFYLAKGATQISLWAVHWAYTFDIKQYDVLAITMGDNFQNNLLGQPGFRLKELCWLALFSWAGFMALRGKLAAAGAEMLTTIVALLLSAVLIGNRQLYMDAVWDLMDEASTTVLVAGMGGDPSQPTTREELVRKMQRQIQIIFIEDPYDYLNWGRPLGNPQEAGNPLRACAAARYYILSRGPHGSDPLPRVEMTAAGGSTHACDKLVEYNRDPDGNRLLGAVLVMISSWTAGGLMITMGLTVVVGKITALLMFGLVPFVGVLAILPAQGRRLAWGIVLAMGKAVVVVVGIGGALSITMLSLTSVADVTENVSMIERFMIVNLVIAIAFSMRRKVIASGEIFTSRMKEYLSTARGQGHDWASTTQGIGADGETALMAADRYLGLGAGYAVGGSAVLASRTYIKRSTEARVARRSYKNLQKVAYWKRRKNFGRFSRAPLP